ncbi:NADH-quinone oxidoreductase subunit J [candidate division KSB1 bacterium]|nr:NADH-quinone oxidoreductase subunit J [candidate division KSB1 bacterium]
MALLFYLFALVVAFSAVMVIIRRNPVSSILYLMLVMFSLAGLYVLLGARFIAALQVTVYAGAIMVLFLFVVMLLNLDKPDGVERKRAVTRLIGFLVAGLLLFLSALLVRSNSIQSSGMDFRPMGTAQAVGKTLFTDYLLPLGIVPVLLLAAVLGAVVLTNKKL